MVSILWICLLRETGIRETVEWYSSKTQMSHNVYVCMGWNLKPTACGNIWNMELMFSTFQHNQIYLFFHQENSRKTLIYHHVKVVKKHPHIQHWNGWHFSLTLRYAFNATQYIHILVCCIRSKWKCMLLFEQPKTWTNEKWRSKTRCACVR